MNSGTFSSRETRPTGVPSSAAQQDLQVAVRDLPRADRADMVSDGFPDSVLHGKKLLYRTSTENLCGRQMIIPDITRVSRLSLVTGSIWTQSCPSQFALSI